MRRNERGFLLLGSYYLLSVILLMITIGLTRAATEVSAASRFVARTQAFHLAEGGVDAELVMLSTTGSTVNTLVTPPRRSVNLINPDPNAPCPTTAFCYDIDYEDVSDATHQRVRMTARGLTGGITPPTIQVTVELPSSLPRGAFDFLMAVGMLQMSGNADIVLGDPLDPQPMYITGQLITTLSSRLYVSEISHRNQFNVGSPFLPDSPSPNGFCNHCYEGSPVFPVSPFVVHNWPYDGSVQALPPIVVDLTLYYDKAMAQNALDGQPYHHITTSQTINGNDYPNCLQGIIYVEAGVELTLSNDVCIKGTIVHEGAVYFTAPTWRAKGGILSGSNMRLSINSLAPADINGTLEPPFAPGVAILGGPVLNFQNNSYLMDWKDNPGDPNAPGIRGFIMAGSGGSWVGGSMFGDMSNIASTGLVAGGLIGAESCGWWSMLSTDGEEAEMGITYPNYFDYNVPGPVRGGVMGPILFDWYRGNGPTIGGSAHLKFVPLTEAPPGFEPGVWNPVSGGSKPTVLLWDGG